MVRGHFRIRDRLRSRIPGSDFRVLDQREERVEIEFPGLLRLVFSVEDRRLVARFSGSPAWANRLWVELAARPGEHLYGGGEQFSVLDLRGRRLPIWVQEQGVGRSRGPDHTPGRPEQRERRTAGTTPTFPCRFWSPRPTGTAWPTAALMPSSTCARRPVGIACISGRSPSRLVFDAAGSAPGLLESLSALGRQPPLPEWTQDGVWLGVQGGTEAIRRRSSKAREAGVRVAAVWVQDWEGRRVTAFGSQLMWNWVYDEERYPGLPGLIEELHGRGIRFLGYINPFLAIEKELYREASGRGLCVKDARAGTCW